MIFNAISKITGIEKDANNRGVACALKYAADILLWFAVFFYLTVTGAVLPLYLPGYEMLGTERGQFWIKLLLISGKVLLIPVAVYVLYFIVSFIRDGALKKPALYPADIPAVFFIISVTVSYALSDEKQIAQESDLASLHALAEKGCNRNLQILSKKVQKRSFDCRDDMDACSEVERLKTPLVILVVSQIGFDLQKRLSVIRKACPQDQWQDLLNGLGYLLTARDLSGSDVALAVFHHHNISCEVRGMCTAEVQKHRIVAGNRIDLGFGDVWDHVEVSYLRNAELFRPQHPKRCRESGAS